MNVAVVESAEPILKEIIVLLDQFNWLEVNGYSNGELLLQNMKQFQPDLAIINPVLPGMDGITLSRKLKAANPGIKIVFMSSDRRHALAAYDQNADDFLLMPFDRSRMTMTIERVWSF